MKCVVCQALAWLGLMLPMVLPGPLSAAEGSLQISPLRLEFDKAGATSIITVKNRKDKPALIQLEALSWTQQDGQDIQQLTSDILATPPVFTIVPDGEQIIRVGLRKPPDPQRQLTYRLYIREVPDMSNPEPPAGTVRVMIGFSLPVFVKPLAKLVRKTQWKAKADSGKTLQVSLENQGNGHLQIRRFIVTGSNDRPVAEMRQMTYVLQQQQKSWSLPVAQPIGETVLQLIADTDDGELRAELLVERR